MFAAGIFIVRSVGCRGAVTVVGEVVVIFFRIKICERVLAHRRRYVVSRADKVGSTFCARLQEFIKFGGTIMSSVGSHDRKMGVRAAGSCDGKKGSNFFCGCPIKQKSKENNSTGAPVGPGTPESQQHGSQEGTKSIIYQ